MLKPVMGMEKMNASIYLSYIEYDLIAKTFEAVSENYKIEKHVKKVDFLYSLLVSFSK